jgi:hypothetical protein
LPSLFQRPTIPQVAALLQFEALSDEDACGILPTSGRAETSPADPLIWDLYCLGLLLSSLFLDGRLGYVKHTLHGETPNLILSHSTSFWTCAMKHRPQVVHAVTGTTVLQRAINLGAVGLYDQLDNSSSRAADLRSVTSI